MSKDKLPNIAFRKGVERIEGVLPNGVRYGPYALGKKDDFIEIEAQDRDLRAALLNRGGIEMVKQPWYVRRDCPCLSIPQWDGTTHQHRPARSSGLLGAACDGKDCVDSKCEHIVVCDSVACQDFFWDEWRRAFPAVRPIDVGSAASRIARKQAVVLPIAAPSKAQRPMNTDEYEAAVNRSAEEAAGLQSAAAVGRAIADALQPHLYQEQPTAKR